MYTLNSYYLLKQKNRRRANLKLNFKTYTRYSRVADEEQKKRS